MTPGILDLVQYRGELHIVVKGGETPSIVPQKTWPSGFDEIGSFVPQVPVEVPTTDLIIIDKASEMLTQVSMMIVESDTGWQEREQTDWNDVDRVLEYAIMTLPSPVLSVDMEAGSWRLSDDVPEEMLPLVRPLATWIGTHAVGNGDADLSDISRAVEEAKAALEHVGAAPSAPTP